MPRPPSSSRSPAVLAEAPRPLRALLFADALPRGEALVQRLAQGGMQATLMADAAHPDTPGEPRLAVARDACDALLLHLEWPLDRLVPLLVALRQRSGAPIALLREQGDDEHDVAALEAGFDAAWQSAIDDRVLWARLRALVRARRRPPAPPPALTLGRLRVDLQAALAAVDGRLLRLTRTQFELLACLATQPGIVVSRGALLRVLAAALGPDLRPRALDSALSRLRLRLATAHSGVRIVAVPRRGYRLDATAARR